MTAKVARLPLGDKHVLLMPKPLYKRWLEHDPEIVEIVDEWCKRLGLTASIVRLQGRK